MGKVIGIDLGTTNSCVSVVEGGEPVIIPNTEGNRTTPSIVAFSKNGERLVGGPALRQTVTNAERTFSSVKRHIGTDWTAKVDGHIYKPQVLSAYVLMQLKKDAERYLGEPVTGAVITVPAYFNDVQRQATKDAGQIAGLEVKRIINEPTSAALSYGLDHGEPQKVLVYDLGGGTFDVSVIEIGEGVIEVLSTAGDNHLGGDDFDTCIVDWLVDKLKRTQGVNIKSDFTAMQRVREAAETAKKELSSTKSTFIQLPYISQKGGQPIHLETSLTRFEFSQMIEPLIARTEIPVRNAIADAGLTPDKLDKVILVGGSTRIPAVQAKVQRLTGKEPTRNIDPDECVAKGAALLGNTLEGNEIVANGAGHELLLLDVTPLSLSIETVGGVATRLVDRNTRLPIRYSRVFSTAVPYQRDVEIHVLQGERPMAKDNKTIGKFKLKGIKRAPAGVPQIEVTFDIDTNGILRVSAVDKDTGKEQAITITADDRMSDAEIQQAILDAQEYASVDSLRTETLSLLSESQHILAKLQRKLKEDSKGMDKAVRKDIQQNCKALQKCIHKIRVDKVKAEEVAELRTLMEKVKPYIS